MSIGSFSQTEPPVSVARQPDGKFVTTGSVRNVFGPTIHVSRFNATFTLDTSFSGDETAPLPGLRPTAVAVQDDGKIVSVATSTSEARHDRRRAPDRDRTPRHLARRVRQPRAR